MQFLNQEEERKKHEAFMDEIEEELKAWCKMNGEPYDEDEDILENTETEEEVAESEEEKLARYKDEFDSICWINCKSDILHKLDDKIKEIKKDMEAEADSVGFYRMLISLLLRFKAEVQKRILLEPLPSFWGYSIEIDEVGISLILKNFAGKEDSCHNIEFEEKEAFILFTIEPKMLTIEEYAALYDVKPVTVRQWLRRGKIRTAVKTGREWRIPEVTEPCRKGYMNGAYKILSELKDIPEEYEILNQCTRLSIEQEKSGLFKVSFYRDGHYEDHGWPFASAKMEEDERAKFELMLISHPLVKGMNGLSLWDVIECI